MLNGSDVINIPWADLDLLDLVVCPDWCIGHNSSADGGAAHPQKIRFTCSFINIRIVVFLVLVSLDVSTQIAVYDLSRRKHRLLDCQRCVERIILTTSFVLVLSSLGPLNCSMFFNTAVSLVSCPIRVVFPHTFCKRDTYAGHALFLPREKRSNYTISLHPDSLVLVR